MLIKFYIGCDEHNKVYHKRYAEVISELPQPGGEFNNEQVVKVKEVRLDAEQPSEGVRDYRYYKVATTFTEGEDDFEETFETNYYVAIKIAD